MKQGEMRNATDVVMAVLEDFAKSEGISVVILHTNEAGDMCITSNATKSMGLGLCEYGKQSIIRRIFED